MSKIIKARVLRGQFAGEIVRISNVSADEMGRKKAACILTSGVRANIPVEDLEQILEEPTKEPTVRRAQTASMPFISGSSSSRTLTHTKNMQKNKVEPKLQTSSSKKNLAECQTCGSTYNIEDRKGHAGKLTDCENCADESENKI